jgi:hypothetical protein
MTAKHFYPQAEAMQAIMEKGQKIPFGWMLIQWFDLE